MNHVTLYVSERTDMCILASMSKKALKKYLEGLKKKELEHQIMDLYGRFAEVKTYYDFVFNPREDKLLQQAKQKISNEYFPLKRKRPKARRSVAQKFIKHFRTLGMDPYLIADLMLFNLETAQRYSERQKVNDAFYKSMLTSFREVMQHTILHGQLPDFRDRILSIHTFTQEQAWSYAEEFDRILENAILSEGGGD